MRRYQGLREGHAYVANGFIAKGHCEHKREQLELDGNDQHERQCLDFHDWLKQEER